MTALFTIGHSRHDLQTFAALLAAHRITLLVDVRAAPYSRRHPQFNREALDTALAAHGIRYRWLGQPLGGLREVREPSIHTALAEPAFRAYAAHLADADFVDAIDRLIVAADRHRLAVMCAEADHVHCHRQFIADVLTVRGQPVSHIRADGSLQPHTPHPSLRVDGERLVYDRHGQGDLF
jgi:uncharacterized protein (DUF488 family)